MNYKMFKNTKKFDDVSFEEILGLFDMFLNNQLAQSKAIGAGLSTIGLTGAGVGIGIVFGCLMLSYGRRPELKNELFGFALLGFALTEAIALFALMMAFIILYT